MSRNFAFVKLRDPLIYRYASLAERYLSDDPNGSLVKMRQFAEALTHATAACFGSPASTETAFADVIRGLASGPPDRIVNLLHDVRRLGSRPPHAHADDRHHALTAFQVGHKLAGWFHATFRAKGFKASPFVIPPNPADAGSA